jgi:hypothetical protein
MLTSRSSDLTGAITYNLTPYLPQVSPSKSHIWSPLPSSLLHSLSTTLSERLNSTLHPQLLPILTALTHFTHAITTAGNPLARDNPSSHPLTLNPDTFSADLHALQHALLALGPIITGAALPSASASEATRLAALLYMHHLLPEFPHSVTGPTMLLTALQRVLPHVTIAVADSSHPLPLTLFPLLDWITTVATRVAAAGAMRLWFEQFREDIPGRARGRYLEGLYPLLPLP